MKITNTMRNKYPTLNDENIADVIRWNRHYNNECLKEICHKIIRGVLYVALGTLALIAIATVIACTIHYGLQSLC